MCTASVQQRAEKEAAGADCWGNGGERPVADAGSDADEAILANEESHGAHDATERGLPKSGLGMAVTAS